MEKIDKLFEFFSNHSILILGSMATIELLCLVENRLKDL